MSIFKETFPKFLRDQLEVRQKIIASGAGRNDDKFTFGENSRSENFYTYSLNKVCTVRMSSAVDVIDEGIFSEETGFGANPAKTFILEGGIKKEGRHRSGFVDTYDENSNLYTGEYAYGDKEIRADAADGYGIVPMPGIISVDVRTKSAYGSLREAKVTFKCHNRRQLEILEVLYMRPGYTILLEWGWNPYINNDEERENWSFIDGFFDQNKTMGEIERQILFQKEQTGGNYDALIGYCKNFTYKLRADGGFDCETEIIAKGEVLTSLKGGKETVLLDDEQNVYSRPALEEILMELDTLADGVIGTKVKKKAKKAELQEAKSIADDLIEKLDLSKENGYFNDDPVDPTPGLPTESENERSDTNIDPNIANEDLLKPWIIADGPTGYQYDQFLMFEQDAGRGEQQEKYKNKEDGFTGQKKTDKRLTTCWVRWDALCHLINKYVIPDDAYGRPIVQLQTHQIVEQNRYLRNNEVEISPLQYADYTPYQLAGWLPEIEATENALFGDSVLPDVEERETRKIDWSHVDVSLNNEICMFPHTIYRNNFARPDAFHTDLLFQPLAQQLYESIPRNKTVVNRQGAGRTLRMPGSTEQQTLHNSEFNIGGIYLGVEFLIALFNDHFYSSNGTVNSDATLFGYIEKIWKNVNEISGDRHEFTLHTDNKPQGKIVRVIDLQADAFDLDRSKIFELKIQSLDSVVRNISYNTTIPSSLSATIAIAAQAPDDIEALDQVTFAAINKGIKDRFSSKYSKSRDEILFGENSENKTQVTSQWKKRFNLKKQDVWNALHVLSYKDGPDDLIDQALESAGVIDAAAIGVTIGYGISVIASGGTTLLAAGLYGLGALIYGFTKKKELDRIKREEHGGLIRELIYYEYNKSSNRYLTPAGAVDLASVDHENVGKYRAALKQLHSAIDYFGKVYGSDAPNGAYYVGQPYNGASQRVSSIIPLKFNAQLDGIGGLVIGNIFKLPKSRLPLAYKGDDIFFIVMGEEQKITAGGDWVTTLTGQITLLGENNQNTREYQEWVTSWENVDKKIDDASIKGEYKTMSSRASRGGAAAGRYNFTNVVDYYTDPNNPPGNLGSPIGRPLDGRSRKEGGDINSHFGPRDLNKDGVYTPHRGVDIRGKQGDPLYAVFDGRVSFAGDSGGASGGLIKLRLDTSKIATTNSRGQGVPDTAVYCHCSAFSVSSGDRVVKGQLIGAMGGEPGHPLAGRSTGPHLHFGLKSNGEFIPPLGWIGKGSNEAVTPGGAAGSGGAPPSFEEENISAQGELTEQERSNLESFLEDLENE